MLIKNENVSTLYIIFHYIFVSHHYGNNDIIVHAEEQEHLGNAKGIDMTSILKKLWCYT